MKVLPLNRWLRLDVEFLLLGLFVFLDHFRSYYFNSTARILGNQLALDAVTSASGLIFISFAIKYLLLIVLTLFALQQIKRSFQAVPGAVALSVLIYSLLFCLVYYPFLLESYPLPLGFFRTWNAFVWAGYPPLWALGCIALLLNSARWRPSKGQALSVAFIGLFALLNNPYCRLNFLTSANNTIPAAGSVLVVGVDAMNFDALDSIPLEKYPALRAFLRDSRRFQNARTNVARTLPSFISFFSGVPATSTGIRGTFYGTSRSTDEILKGSVTQRFVEKGGEASVLFNDYSFANFQPGKVISRVGGPDQGAHNNFLSVLFRNILFFGLYNNLIGRSVVPEIVNNGAMADTYFPQYFLPEVTAEIARFNPGKPFLKVTHLVKAHFPYSVQYPFYRVVPRSAFSESAYKFESIGKHFSTQRISRTADELANQELYRDSMLQIVDTYLEPLLKTLEENRFKNLTIVLFSDHGENTRFTGAYPKSSLIHGSWVGFGDQSERIFLAIKGPGAEALPEIRSVSQILPSIFHERKSDDGQSMFVEADRDLEKNLPGQIYTSVFKNVVDLAVDKDGRVQYSRESNDLQLAYKTRRIVAANGSSLTVYPSKFGYQVFFENIKSETDKSRLLADFNRLYASDIRSGLIPALRSPEPKSPVAGFAVNGPYSKFVNALEEFHWEAKFSEAAKHLREVMKSSDSGRSLKTAAALEIGRLCALGEVEPAEYDQVVKILLKDLPPSTNLKNRFDVFNSYARCFQSAGKEIPLPQARAIGAVLDPLSAKLEQLDDDQEFRRAFKTFQAHQNFYTAPFSIEEEMMRLLELMRNAGDCNSAVEQGLRALDLAPSLSRWSFPGMGDPVAIQGTIIAKEKNCLNLWAKGASGKAFALSISAPIRHLLNGMAVESAR